MNKTIELPVYNKEELASCSVSQLIENMIRDEDRVPRNVIDECVQRGEQMLDALATIEISSKKPESDIDGHWWMQLHVVMILGLIPGEDAGMRLVQVIHNMNRNEDVSLQDWLAGYWPALTRNKPAQVIQQLRETCEDKKVPWFMRSNLTDVVVASGYWQDSRRLEQALDWVVQQVMDEEEDWDYRLVSANTLLNFPRERYRDVLNELAIQQSGFNMYFDENDINRAYSMSKDQPDWERFNNPWSFYEKKEIEKRQRRWQTEGYNEEEVSFDPYDVPDSFFDFDKNQTYQRQAPKVGRNDPCPCGSGKKYKKCCLH